MFSVAKEKTWIKLALALIIATTLALSVFVVVKYGNYFLLGSMQKMDNDDVKYIRSAATLLQTGMLTYHDVTAPTVFIMPGLPFLLAAVFKFFGSGDSGLTAFRIVQAVLNSASIYLIFLIGREVFNSKVAILACLVDALYIPEYTNVGLLLTEIEFKFLVLLLVYISIYALKTRRSKYYIWGGIIWGLTCLFRPTITVFPGVILLMWLVNKYSFKEMLRYSSIVVGIFIVIMSPWWVRNYLEFNRIILLTLSSGNPFLQGTYINYDHTRDFTPYTPPADAVQRDQVELDTGKYRLRTYFGQHPLEYIKWYTLGKSKYLWRVPHYWRPVLNVSIIQATVYHAVILLFGIVGAALSYKNKVNGALLVFGVIGLFDLIHLPYFTFPRYVYPVMPLVMLFSAYGMARLAYGIGNLLRLGVRASGAKAA